jgi:hypothetical protein
VSRKERCEIPGPDPPYSRHAREALEISTDEEAEKSRYVPQGMEGREPMIEQSPMEDDGGGKTNGSQVGNRPVVETDNPAQAVCQRLVQLVPIEQGAWAWRQPAYEATLTGSLERPRAVAPGGRHEAARLSQRPPHPLESAIQPPPSLHGRQATELLGIDHALRERLRI